jgi:hypothetical protein
MRALLACCIGVVGISGCAPVGYQVGPAAPVGAYYDNPTLAPPSDPQGVWETVVDVVDDYFPIEREEPVRRYGETITEGQIDTYPVVSRTLLEPWRRDVTGGYELTESTLQSMRRRAVVRVYPSPGQPGYFVDVAVLKYLEDVAWPEHATAGASTFRYDGSLTRVVNPVTEQETTEGWVPQGRDHELEQRIIGELQKRWGAARCQPQPRSSP